LDNYQFTDKLRDAHEASVEISMLMGSIRTAVETVARCGPDDYAILQDASAYQREAVKIRLLATRIAELTARTAWPTPEELKTIDPATAAMLRSLADGDCYA
jgi:hypothetical protein